MQSLDVISVNIWQMLASLANLVLIFLLVKKFLYKPVKKMLETRQNAIQSDYDAAEDANATKTYNVKVVKEPIVNDNANLKSLTVAGNNVTVSDYMIFSTAESKVEIVAKAENENASVRIDGKALTALEVNVPGTVAIVVTAEDGTVKNYTLELKKNATPICLAKLKTVTVNGETVTPNSVMSYTSKTTTADIGAFRRGTSRTVRPSRKPLSARSRRRPDST